MKPHIGKPSLFSDAIPGPFYILGMPNSVQSKTFCPDVINRFWTRLVAGGGS